MMRTLDLTIPLDLSIAIAPDGASLTCASRDPSIRFLRLSDGSPAPASLAHPGAVLSVAYSADGARLATGASDGRVRVWDVATRALVSVSPAFPDSASALAEDLERYLTSQPIAARPPSAVYTLAKFAQRRRALVAGAAATLAVLVAGAAVSTGFALREAEQRREAEAARRDLEAVAEFQERMLSEVDAELMGRRLFEDLRAGLAEALAGDPDREARLWPHEYGPVYRAFDRIFGCRGHGWSNLQSTHLNLPFRGDEEFGRLHAAVRLVLPLLPALAASTPIVEGRVGRHLDTRMETYRHNAAKVPSVSSVGVGARSRPCFATSRCSVASRSVGTVRTRHAG